MNIQKLILVVFLIVFFSSVQAKGQGPIGLWAATERFVVVADSSLPGIVLVDLETGTTVERLNFAANIGARTVSISSCKNCNFLFVVGKNMDDEKTFWKIMFNASIAHLLRNNERLDFNSARIIELNPMLPIPYEQELFDPRMSLVSKDGNTAYIASSNMRAVFRIDLNGASEVMEVFLDAKSHKPYGLNWDHQGGMLVSMHKKKVWRVNFSGEVLKKYDASDCPGVKEGKPNLRAAIDDPYNDNSLIVLASNPLSYDGVIWRLTHNAKGRSVNCENLAGKINRDSHWIDSYLGGEHVFFSRPHYFVKHPDVSKSQIILTDIDNRALRIVDLKNGATTSVLYDRDIRRSRIPQQDQYSHLSCSDIRWEQSQHIRGIRGQQVCMRAFDGIQSSLKQAKTHCADQGARLCEPAELRQSNLFPQGVTWTAAPCASCWQRTSSDKCTAIIKTQRSAGKHSTEGFSHSWSTGQAVEYGVNHEQGPATFCAADAELIKAHSVCCADDL